MFSSSFFSQWCQCCIPSNMFLVFVLNTDSCPWHWSWLMKTRSCPSSCSFRSWPQYAMGASILAEGHTNSRTSNQITAIKSQMEVSHRSVDHSGETQKNSRTSDPITAIEIQLEEHHRILTEILTERHANSLWSWPQTKLSQWKPNRKFPSERTSQRKDTQTAGPPTKLPQLKPNNKSSIAASIFAERQTAGPPIKLPQINPNWKSHRRVDPSAKNTQTAKPLIKIPYLKLNLKSSIGASILAEKHTNSRTSYQIIVIETQLEVAHQGVDPIGKSQTEAFQPNYRNWKPIGSPPLEHRS